MTQAWSGCDGYVLLLLYTFNCCLCNSNSFSYSYYTPSERTFSKLSWVLPGAHKTWIIWNVMKRVMPEFIEPVLQVFEPLIPLRMKRVRAQRHGVNHSPRRFR